MGIALQEVQEVQEVQEHLRTYQPTPQSNTIYFDSTQRMYYRRLHHF